MAAAAVKALAAATAALARPAAATAYGARLLPGMALAPRRLLATPATNTDAAAAAEGERASTTSTPGLDEFFDKLPREAGPKRGERTGFMPTGNEEITWLDVLGVANGGFGGSYQFLCVLLVKVGHGARTTSARTRSRTCTSCGTCC